MRRARERCELQGLQRTWLPRAVTDVPFGMALESLTAADQPNRGDASRIWESKGGREVHLC